MNLRLSSHLERLRSSLFFVPMLAVVAACGLGLASLAIDARVGTALADLPLGFTSTVESARALLGVIAGATISFAGIAFSVSLLLIQLGSSQYSPRVVHTLFRDPFNKRVMALVCGTFTYCVVVLRSVRTALEPGGDPVVPNISVAVAVVLGVATILAIVAFINHSAHTMDVSEILERITRETVDQIRAEWIPSEPVDAAVDELPARSPEPSAVIRSDRSGWIQQIDRTALLSCLPDGVTAYVETRAGWYTIEGSRLITLKPASEVTSIEDEIRAAFAIGETRTSQQDVSYGLRQLADIAVKALSPGINDPTTAQDAIFHGAAVLAELLRHDPPAAVTIDGTRRLVMADRPSHRELVAIAFDETRRAAAAHPTVCSYLLASIHTLIDVLLAAGLGHRIAELRRQAQLVAQGCGRRELLSDDVDDVWTTYRTMFEPGRP
jgi:uncharacterized membrane protein